MKRNRILAKFILITLLIISLLSIMNLSTFAEPTNYKDKFEEVHINYDADVTKFEEWNDSYSIELPLREIIKNFDVTIYPGKEFSYEGSGALPMEVRYGYTSLGGRGTLKLIGNINYDEKTGYPSLDGILTYTCEVTEINSDLQQTINWKAECSGKFSMSTPMLENSSSILTYGGSLVDTDKNIVTKTVTKKDGSKFVDTSDDGFFGIRYAFKSQTKLITAITNSDVVKPPIDNNDKTPISEIIDTDASKTAGENSSSVPLAIVIALVTSVLAAVAGVAGGSLSDNQKDENNNSSTYKMAIYKEFGDKIKYNDDPVFIYARMLEVNSEGLEMERPDLTSQIEIFSKEDVFDIGPNSFAGSYMEASVYAGKEESTSNNAFGVISFRFKGEGGVFQNNVKFKLVGDCSLKLSKQQLFVLGDSKRSFELPYELVDFTKEAEIKLVSMQSNPPFELTIGENKEGKSVIIATDCEDKKIFDKFFNSFTCEIIAKNEKEYARSVFYVEMCYEGILPDFLGKPKEIRGYKVSLDSEEMAETIFNVKLGQWNELESTLDFQIPENININLWDEKNIFNLIGTDIYPDENSVLTDAKRYIVKAKKNFPSNKEIKGTMTLSGANDDKTFENEIEILLIPDIMQYEADYEKEYQSCKRVIETYMAPRFRGKKLYELEKARYHLGIEDFKLFRRNCWSVAEISIMQEAQEYLAEAAWYDEAIATADLVVYIGDIAFNLALVPIGGPITGFLADQVKSSFLELCALYIEGSNKSTWEITMDFLTKRLEQTAGSADGLIEVPKANEPKKLAIWLSTYVLYRIGFHWNFDKDDNGNAIGILESIKKGLLDFVGKGFGVLLGDFINNMGKGRWVEKISVADIDQKIVSDNLSKATNVGLSAMDKVATKADDVITLLMGYLEKLKIG